MNSTLNCVRILQVSCFIGLYVIVEHFQCSMERRTDEHSTDMNTFLDQFNLHKEKLITRQKEVFDLHEKFHHEIMEVVDLAELLLDVFRDESPEEFLNAHANMCHGIESRISLVSNLLSQMFESLNDMSNACNNLKQLWLDISGIKDFFTRSSYRHPQECILAIYDRFLMGTDDGFEMRSSDTSNYNNYKDTNFGKESKILQSILMSPYDNSDCLFFAYVNYFSLNRMRIALQLQNVFDKYMKYYDKEKKTVRQQVSMYIRVTEILYNIRQTAEKLTNLQWNKYNNENDDYLQQLDAIHSDLNAFTSGESKVIQKEYVNNPNDINIDYNSKISNQFSFCLNQQVLLVQLTVALSQNNLI